MILLVDDKQENIFALKSVLEQHGFQTDSALSGEEALKKLLKFNYALIILDVQMPVMDGFEVAEAITGLNKTKDIPLIFLSAVNTHKKFIRKGFESGAVEYLTKPVDPDILILKVRNFYRLYEKTAALKEAEKALQTTVDELQTTLESLPQLAFTADRNGVIEYVNRQWLDYAGSKEEFPDTPEHTPSLRQLWLNAMAGGAAIEKEIAIRNKADGQFYFHLLKASPIAVNGIIRRWVGTFTNVHEQKLLNETLERKVAERTRDLLEMNRELEITNNDLQQFTSVASHDLKEPLRKIQFFSDRLLEKAQLEGELARYLDKILASSARMSNLVTDLLSFASLSQPNPFEPTDLNSIIREIQEDLELLIAEKKARIEVPPLPQIDTIPGLIRQLFQNIISNALKFTREGVPPHIQITSDLLLLPDPDAEPDEKGTICRITIADNGIGLDEKYAHKIFTIFQRLNDRSSYEGTGIGLAIAKKVIDKHNGLITVRSTPGEGARFIVLLPVRQAARHLNGSTSVNDIAAPL
ncbi:MAG TPA: response regulator [Flavisolibacter sp.]|jgi:signal transduction histidine kinase|nr:response regulator [Flavisolibacter sp.]